MRKFGVMAAVVVASVAVSAPANAAGCNGVVNPLVWGCAPWDNNNGPQFPNWRGAAPAAKNNSGSAASAAAERERQARAAAMAAAAAQAQGGRLIGNDGSTLVGNDGASRRGR